MAETFKNAKKVLATTALDVYECPAATTAIVIGCQATNRGAATCDLDFWWTDDSDADAEVYLADAVTVPIGAAYEPIGGKLVLEAGDKLRGLGETASDLEVTVSVVELT